MECLGRIPYTSVIGFISVMIGCAVTSATLYDSINRTDELLTRFFFKINFLHTVLMTFTALSIVLVIICLFVLVFAFIATLATRNKVYHRTRCILGGRKTAAVLMFVLFIANIVWIGIMCMLMVPVLGWLMLSSTCRYEISQYDASKQFNFNFSLNNYGIYSEYLQTDFNDKMKTTISEYYSYKQFCQLISTIGPLYTCSAAGALVVILGLITFIGSLSSLYMRLKYTKELTNFIVAFEDQKNNELDYIVNTKAM